MSEALQISTIVSELFEENCFIVWLKGNKEAIAIDPGLDPPAILQELSDRKLNVAAILNTHGHADHIAGNAALKQIFPTAPLIIGQGDAHMLSDADANLSAPFGMRLQSPPADRLISEGDIVEAAGIRLEVVDLPGHSPGHVIFIYRSRPIVVFGGDVLFRGSIGRTDFFNSRPDLFIPGIHRKVLTLPPDTIVYPGHGPLTTVGYERDTNPFLQGTSQN